MQILRKSALGVISLLLVTTLLTFGITFGLLRVFGDADSVKGALARSGIYDSVIEDALAQAQETQGTAKAGKDQLPLDRPEVQSIIKSAASPELLQAKTENALDAVYAWLHGDTPSLAFNLEIGDIKANLGNGIEQYVTQHVASLPVCASGTPDTVSDDPFNAACRPQGVDANQIAAQSKNEFLNGEALKDTTISADSIKSGDGKTLAQKVEDAPDMYHKVSGGVYGSGVLALLLAVGVVFLSATWRSGVKKVSIIFIVIGALNVIASLLTRAGMRRAAEAAKEPLQQSGVRVADALVGGLRNWWLWFGIGLIVSGAAALVALHFFKPKSAAATIANNKPDEPEPTGETLPSHAESAQREFHLPDKPKSKPAKKLVQ